MSDTILHAIIAVILQKPMLGYHLAFDAPAFLLCLVALPLLWWFALRSLAGLGPVRRWAAIVLRSCVLIAVVFSLAEIQWVRTSRRLTVIYLLDQSASIPDPQRRAMVDYVNAEIKKHRNADLQDRAGVIDFGADAAVEYPPVDESVRISPEAQQPLDADRTNIAGALRTAMASFPPDSARRVVIVTDGNENVGNALEQARIMAASGVGIDVVPVRYAPRVDVAVERITVPQQVTLGQPFDLRVVLNNTAPSDENGASTVRGKLEIRRTTGETEKLLSRDEVSLPPGKRVVSLREKIDSPDFYTYEARYIPDDPAQDFVTADNRATSFTHVRGQGQVLLIENYESPGEFASFVDRLRKQTLHVTVRPSNQLFTSLADLQPFDTVILADVPGEDFSTTQVEMLARNTQQMGSGLIMLGGPNSFGAGGWTGTELEAAMPVDFQIKNSKVRPPGALALVIDRSGSMTGEKLALAKSAAMAAVEVLAPNDFVTAIAFDAVATPVVPLVKKENSDSINARIQQIAAAGGTNMYPAMNMAYAQLAQASDAGVRHMLLLTDGMTEGAGYAELVKKMREEQRITVSTVAVGADADVKLLEQLAQVGGGKFYQAKSPKSLPRIFQQEARVVAKPLIFEKESGFEPQLISPHDMLKGIGDTLPPITGYVLTTKKANPLVEVVAVAPIGPEASTPDNRTILAGWSFGLGKAVVLTTDLGNRWASNWASSPNYDKILSQMVRWSMRPAGDEGKFTVTADPEVGKVQVTVTALDNNDEFLNFLNVSGSVVGPEMKPIELKIHQSAPGRYTGSFDAQTPGSYLLTLKPGPGLAPIVSGVNMPYSPEFLDREPNEALMSALAALIPKGSKSPGLLIADAGGLGTQGLLEFDTFRHDLPKATSSQGIWPELMLLAACLFFADVLVRRVRINLSALAPLVAHVFGGSLGRQVRPVPLETLQRLRTRKMAVTHEITQLQSDARLEPLTAEQLLAASAPPSSTALAEPPSDEADYTRRLLQAKKNARGKPTSPGGKS